MNFYNGFCSSILLLFKKLYNLVKMWDILFSLNKYIFQMMVPLNLMRWLNRCLIFLISNKINRSNNLIKLFSMIFYKKVWLDCKKMNIINKMVEKWMKRKNYMLVKFLSLTKNSLKSNKYSNQLLKFLQNIKTLKHTLFIDCFKLLKTLIPSTHMKYH
jgi:hypothetical protein